MSDEIHVSTVHICYWCLPLPNEMSCLVRRPTTGCGLAKTAVAGCSGSGTRIAFGGGVQWPVGPCGVGLEPTRSLARHGVRPDCRTAGQEDRNCGAKARRADMCRAVLRGLRAESRRAAASSHRVRTRAYTRRAGHEQQRPPDMTQPARVHRVHVALGGGCAQAPPTRSAPRPCGDAAGCGQWISGAAQHPPMRPCRAQQIVNKPQHPAAGANGSISPEA